LFTTPLPPALDARFPQLRWKTPAVEISLLCHRLAIGLLGIASVK
jgi:hypothetical protein